MSWYYRLLSAVYISTFIIRASFGALMITFPLYLNIDSPALLGTIMALPPLAELITVMIVGVVIDKYGRKNVLLGGLFLGALAIFMIATTTNIYLLSIINILHGISAGTILVSSLALLADYIPQNSRGKGMGAFDFANLFGWLVGFGLGGILVDVFRNELWLRFVLDGILALICVIYAFFTLEEPGKESHIAEEINFGHVKAVFTQKSIMLLMIPWLIIYLFIGAILTFASVAGVKGMNLPATYVGLALGGAGVIFLATQIFFGKMSDKYGRAPIMFLGVIGVLGLASTVGVVSILTPPSGPIGLNYLVQIAPAIPLILIFALMCSAFAPSALASLADEAHEKRRGTTMGIYSMVISAGMSIGPPAFGFISQYGGTLGTIAFIFCTSMIMFVAVILKYVHGKKEVGEKPRLWDLLVWARLGRTSETVEGDNHDMINK
jgi:MFS family permease